jgi:two-component system response regulator BaeR
MSGYAPGGRRIMVVEDDDKNAAILIDFLHASGYTTTRCSDGTEVAPAVRADAPAAIILDLMLPGLDGVEMCKQVRSFSSVPIIMVTARIDEIDRLIGLEIGADDYVCKPFYAREVMARVKALLRREDRDGGVHAARHVGDVVAGTRVLA